MTTAIDLRKLPEVSIEKLPGLIVNKFNLDGLQFAVCLVDPPFWWPFGGIKLRVCRVVGFGLGLAGRP